jgi:hypothetical protein
LLLDMLNLAQSYYTYRCYFDSLEAASLVFQPRQ